MIVIMVNQKVIPVCKLNRENDIIPVTIPVTYFPGRTSRNNKMCDLIQKMCAARKTGELLPRSGPFSQFPEQDLI